MKILFTKTALTGFLLILLGMGAKAQYTENFESQPPNVNTFTSKGQSFALTNAFSIYSSRVGIGYNRSKRFIDNVKSRGTNQLNSIKTADAKLFTVQNFWLFMSDDGGNNPSQNGSLIITGKINGVVVFTVNKTSGFNSSFGSNDGFIFVDLSTEGGANNAIAAINEISFQLQGDFDYMAVDDFTWAPGLVLPVAVIDFSGFLKSDKVLFDWKTSCESNSSHFVVERSSDGFSFKPLSSVEGAGFCNTITKYNTVDDYPLPGMNYYRLIAVDFDGKRKQHGSFIIKNTSGQPVTSVYPNPANGNIITLQINKEMTGKLYTITDISGKMVQHGIIGGSGEKINISRLGQGMYSLRLSDGQRIQWIKN